MSAVWVVMCGTDSEGGWVMAVTSTAEAGMAYAEAHLPVANVPALEWRAARPGAEWFARLGKTGEYIEVTRWEVSP